MEEEIKILKQHIAALSRAIIMLCEDFPGAAREVAEEVNKAVDVDVDVDAAG